MKPLEPSETWSIVGGTAADFVSGIDEGEVQVRITEGPHAGHTVRVHTKATKDRYEVILTCSCGATITGHKALENAPGDESVLRDVALFFVTTAGSGIP